MNPEKFSVNTKFKINFTNGTSLSIDAMPKEINIFDLIEYIYQTESVLNLIAEGYFVIYPDGQIFYNEI